MVFLGIYRAIYDYAPHSENELALSEGDLLMVLEKSTDDDWWKAKKKVPSEEEDEPEGLIPNNYVEEVSCNSVATRRFSGPSYHWDYTSSRALTCPALMLPDANNIFPRLRQCREQKLCTITNGRLTKSSPSKKTPSSMCTIPLIQTGPWWG
jgi:hypothetical protein